MEKDMITAKEQPQQNGITGGNSKQNLLYVNLGCQEIE